MRRNYIYAGAALSVACWLSRPVQADVLLVENGAPKATIVVANDVIGAPTEPSSPAAANPTVPDPNSIQPRRNKVAAAARDLQLYIEKLSGARLPIAGDDQPLPAGAVVFVGRSALTRDFDKKIPSGMTPTRDEEGYLVLAQGNRLLLAGNDDPVYHGTEYAVSNLLHRLGVRWYMPGDFGDFVPHQATIKINDLNFTGKPDFKMRNWWGGSLSPAMVLEEYRWKIRNGMNPMLHFVTLPADSSIRSVLPPAADLNKKELAKVWGLDEKGNPNPAMPNLASEESVKFAAEVIKKRFREHPEDTSSGIGADDGSPVDFSPETMKRNLGLADIGGRNGIIGELMITDEWMDWIQRVAAEVYKEFPDHIITTNGYANRNVPPMYLTPDPKIWIMFAAIWSDTMHAYDNPRSWQTVRQGQMLEQWARMYKNVYMYNYIYYMLSGCGAPIPLAHKTAHDMPLYKKWGVVGFSDEGRTVRGETGVFPTYLRARMMWDSRLDVKREMDEFFANWYGPAAAPAKAFWEDLENTFETTPWLGHEDRILPYVYSDALILRLENDVKQAENLATDPWSKPRGLADRVVLEHLKAYMAMNHAEFAGDYAEAAAQAQKMVDVRKPATAASPWFFDPDPAKGGDARGMYYWGSVQRRDYYRTVADATTGKTGTRIALLPDQARCKLDPTDAGRYQNWFDPKLNDADWTTVSTTMPFYRQVPGALDAQGYPYMGAVWYRLQADVPNTPAGVKVRLYGGVVEPESWIWVNGQFIGHRAYRWAYERPNSVDMDITKALLPGRKNTIVIRIATGENAAQMADGMVCRLFLYTPKAEPLG